MRRNLKNGDGFAPVPLIGKAWGFPGTLFRPLKRRVQHRRRRSTGQARADTKGKKMVRDTRVRLCNGVANLCWSKELGECLGAEGIFVIFFYFTPKIEDIYLLLIKRDIK